MICSRYNAAWIVEVLQDHGLVSWYFFEQLLFELLVDALKAQSCADIYCMRICMLFEWKCWTNCVICSAYNVAWFVGDLQDHCLVVDICLNNC